MMVMAFFEEKDSQNLKGGGGGVCGLMKQEKNKTWWWKRKINFMWKKTREGHHSQKISRSASEAASFSGQRI